MDVYNFDLFDIQQQLLAFMLLNGIFPYDQNMPISTDGRIHRFRTRDDDASDKSGAYCIFYDTWPAGWVEDWRNHTGAISWSFPRENLNQEGQSFFDDAKYKKALQVAKKHQQEALKLQKEKQIEASENARIRFEQARPAPQNHPYLQKKNVPVLGLREMDGKLVVPLRDAELRFMSLQWIDAEGNKKFYPDAPTKGAFYSVALDVLTPREPILIAEGYATMATLYEITGYACVAAMNCHNLLPVAQSLKDKYPDNKIIFMADNDFRTTDNPGITAADEACRKLNLHGVIAPEFKPSDEGSDWNDFRRIYGEDKTRNTLFERIKWACLSDEQKQEASIRKKLSDSVLMLNPAATLKPQEFIGGLFPRDFVSVLAAPSGTGKTIFMQKFVSDLSVGGSVFDGFIDNEPVRKSLIFAGEAGYEMLVRRGASLKWKINPQNALVVDQYRFETNDIPIMLDDIEGWNNVLRLVDMYKPDIIFIDTFSSFHERDENKATEMKPIIRKLASLARDNHIAVVLIHHSRKRTAKERTLSLNQDDVIGSSILNRLVGLIVGIEPMKDDEKTLLVKPLKTWFSAFMPFTYRLTLDFLGRTVMQTDLAPAAVNNSRIFVWNYLVNTFPKGEWFSAGQIVLSEIEGDVSERQIRSILAEFVKTGKLQTRGSNRYMEYSIPDKSKE